MRKTAIALLFAAMCHFVVVMGQSHLSKPTSTSEIYSLFQNPPMTCRPMVRWWWNGNKVNPQELVRELHLLKDAGIGGVEINPIEFPTHGDQDMGIPSLPWLSDAWIDALKVALDTAKALGMTADLIVGSGWPYGGEFLPGADRAKILVNCTRRLVGPMKLEVSEDALFAMADPKVSSAFMGRKMELKRLVLVKTPCSDVNEAVDLMPYEQSGTFCFNIPPGNYTLSALVQVNGFMKVIDGTLGADGPVLDHYNAAAVLRYLRRMSSTIERRMGVVRRYLRAFFTDSMELEGSNWTDDMAAEFKARRGYDVMPYLHFILFEGGKMGNVSSYAPPIEVSDSLQGIIERVRYDFETTKAELLEERFLRVFARWADSLGVQSRAQAYGRGFFPLESSLCVDIPEGESWTTNYLKHKPGEEMSETDYRRGRAYTMINKYVSSAAHLSGKRIVSCEEMTNTYRVFNMSLQELKLGGDQTVCSGITGTVFHGFNYMPQDAPFPGWIRYGAYYNERNPWWPFFHLYNDYKARLYAVLQHCENVADIAILTPTADMWSKMGMQNEPFPSAINAPYQTLVWEAVVKNGGSCDYVSERILRQARMEKGNICYGTRKYNTLLLVGVESISSETAAQLLKFAASGGRVVFVEREPCRSLGMHPDNAAEDARVTDCLNSIRTRYPERYLFVRKPDSNYIGWYRELQERFQLPHALTFDAPDPYVMQVHYRTSDGNDVFFISNSHRYHSCDVNVSFPKGISNGKQLYVWDLETGERKPASGRLFLEPAGSRLLVFEKKQGRAMPEKPQQATTAADWMQLTSWDVELWYSCYGDLEVHMEGGLTDLCKVDSTFAGTARYCTNVPVKKPGRILLDLGRVEGISECYLNGVKIGCHWYGNHFYTIPSTCVKEGDNLLEIRVTTTLGNYVKSLTDNEVAQYWTNRGTKNQPLQPMGLFGPVMLVVEN